MILYDYKESIIDIRNDIVMSANDIIFAPSCPYVIDKTKKDKNKFVIIPEKFYRSFITQINNDTII